MSMLKRLAMVACLTLSGAALGDESAAAALDRFHRAAANADTKAYLAAMTEDVVFLGTDGSERWQGKEFRDFAASHFNTGRGWTYVPIQRDITVTTSGDIAWFDELLQNDDLGTCRGSGVLVKSAGGWRVAQYNLSVPIPNAIVAAVATDIAALQAGTDSTLPAAAVATSSATASGVASGPAASAADDTALEAKSADTKTGADCSKKRFKTNRKAGC